MVLKQEDVADKQDGVRYVRSAHKTREEVDQRVQEIQEVHQYPESFLVNHGIKLVLELNRKVKVVKPINLESTLMLVNILIGLEESWKDEKGEFLDLRA